MNLGIGRGRDAARPISANCVTCGLPKRPRAKEGRDTFMRRRFCSKACVGEWTVSQQEARFWGHIEKGPTCWIWTGRRNAWDYGVSQWDRRKALAHRKSYELLVGPIPDGLELDHLCRVPSCVNPAHLEPVTHRENIARGRGPSGVTLRTNRCQRGHELTPDNTLTPPDGRRRCRACSLMRRRGYRAARRAA